MSNLSVKASPDKVHPLDVGQSDDNGLERINEIVRDALQSIHSSQSFRGRKKHVRSASIDSALREIEKNKKHEEVKKLQNSWLLNRSCYSENEKKRLKEFQSTLQSKITALFGVITVLSSTEVGVAEKGGLLSLLDSAIAASFSFVPGYGAIAGGLWSILTPVEFISELITGRRARLREFAEYLTSFTRMDAISEELSALMTSYYREEVLNPSDNLTILENYISEPIKTLVSNAVDWCTSGYFIKTFITGIDDRQEKPDAGYREHWEALLVIILGKLLGNVLISDVILGDKCLIDSEIAHLLSESLTPISNEPPNFEGNSVDYTLSRLAMLAYETKGKIDDVITKAWQYEEYMFYYENDVQGFVIADNKRIIISFRGTTTAINLLWHDTNIIQRAIWEGRAGIKVHWGFWRALQNVWPSIKERIDEDDERDIYITGHSLGGALALLAAFDLTMHLTNKGKKIHLCTFGQPRCGNEKFADEVSKKIKDYKRFVNYLDPVSSLPLESSHYKHAGELRWFNSKGIAFSESEFQAELKLKEEDPGSLKAFLDWVTGSETRKVRTNFLNRMRLLSNHWMSEYQRHVHKAAPRSFTFSEYLDQVEFKTALSLKLDEDGKIYEYKGEIFVQKHQTLGDGACGVHVLIGKLNAYGEYSYSPEKKAKDIQRAAKKAFLKKLRQQKEKIIIRKLTIDCLEDFKTSSPDLASQYEKIKERKEHEIEAHKNLLTATYLNILKDEDVLPGLLPFLRHNKEEHRNMEDEDLLNVLKINPHERYHAFAAAQGDIDRIVKDEKYAERVWHLSYLQLTSLLREIKRTQDEDLENFLMDMVMPLYIQGVQKSSYYLTDVDLKLAAFLFSKKVVLFSKNQGTIQVFNEAGKDCIAVVHVGLHYSRLEKYDFDIEHVENRAQIESSFISPTPHYFPLVVGLKKPVEKFFGRKAELKKMEALLVPKGKYARQLTQAVVLHGVRGIGKKELTAFFISTYEKYYSLIARIDCTAEEASYRKLAQILKVDPEQNIERMRQDIFHCLENNPSLMPWLLVFDGAIGTQPSPSRGGFVLHISTTRELFEDSSTFLKIGPLSDDDSIRFLRKKTGEEGSLSMYRLAKRIGGFPFILNQVSLAIIREGITISDYFKDEKKWVENLHALGRFSEKTFNKLQKEHPESFNLVCVLAYFYPSRIPVHWINKWLEMQKDKIKPHLTCQKILRVLEDYSLVECSEGQIAIHKLLQELLRLFISQNEPSFLQRMWPFKKDPSKEICPYYQTAVDLLFKMKSLTEKERVCLSHAGALVKKTFFSRLSKNQKIAVLNLLEEANHILLDEDVYQSAIEEIKEIYGSENIQMGHLLNKMGNALYELGQYQNARDHYLDAYEILYYKRKGTHADIIDVLNNLGRVYRILGSYDVSMMRYQEAWEIISKNYPPNQTEIVKGQLNLGSIYQACGRLMESGLFYMLAQTNMFELQMEEQPFTAEFLKEQGKYSQHQGDYTTAQRYFELSLEVLRKIYGDNSHVDIADILTTLGSLFCVTKEYKKAVPHFEEALEIYNKAYDEPLPKVATLLNELGFALVHLGEFQKAKKCLKRAFRLFFSLIQTNSKEPVSLSICMGSLVGTLGCLGETLKSLGEYPKAVKRYQQAIGMIKILSGDGPIKPNSSVAYLLNGLADALLSSGDPEAASEFYDLAWKVRRKIFDDMPHEEIAISLNGLGRAYQALEKYGEAWQCFDEALRIFYQLYPDNSHPDAGMVLSNLEEVTKLLQNQYKQK